MAEERIDKAICKIKALYMTRDLASEAKQMEIIYTAGKLLTGLWKNGQYAMFNDLWHALNEKADDTAREILQPLVKEVIYGEVAFSDEDVKKPAEGEEIFKDVESQTS
jgi:hypothetical protein